MLRVPNASSVAAAVVNSEDRAVRGRRRSHDAYVYTVPEGVKVLAKDDQKPDTTTGEQDVRRAFAQHIHNLAPDPQNGGKPELHRALPWRSRDRDVQRLTFDAYMRKRLVRAKPMSHARIFVKNLAHLSGLAPT